MKREISTEQNGLVYERWQNQFEEFSHSEFVCGIPQSLFMITTNKENGMPNACFHSWSCFSGDAGGFYAILSCLGKHTHTYANIVRDREFCINFLSHDYYENCMDTVRRNSMAENEITSGGFKMENCKTISAPRIAESFLCLECKLEYDVDLSKRNINSLIIGKVVNIAMEETYMEGIDKKYSDKGFMFNVHSPVDFATGKCDRITSAHLSLFEENK